MNITDWTKEHFYDEDEGEYPEIAIITSVEDEAVLTISWYPGRIWYVNIEEDPVVRRITQAWETIQTFFGFENMAIRRGDEVIVV